MSYTNRKITQEEIDANHVQSATDYLIGNAQQNKAVFDKLPEFIANRYNTFIDDLDSQQGTIETELSDKAEKQETILIDANGEFYVEGDSDNESDVPIVNSELTDIHSAIEAQTEVLENMSIPVAVERINEAIDELHEVYVTPQIYGAKGDGVTDDLAAFQSAIASGKNIVVPQANYVLSDYLFIDESVLIEDNGTYINKPLIVSKSITKAPMSILKRVPASLTNLGISWVGAVTFNTDTRKLIICGYEESTIVQVDYDTMAVENTATISELNNHANDITYNPTTGKYYCAAISGNGEILCINADLTLSETIVISGMEYSPSQISYDETNDIYFVGNSQYTSIVDSSFNIMSELSAHANNELFANDYKNIKSTDSQGSTVFDGQFLCGAWLQGENAGINHGRSYARLLTFDYGTGSIKDIYDFPLPILAEEIETAEVIDGNLVLFSCRFGTMFMTTVSPVTPYLSCGVQEYPDYYAMTYTANSYCTATDVGRLRPFTQGNIGVLKFNLLLSTEMPANTKNIVIGNMGIHIYDETFSIVPSQGNLGNLFVDIKTNGDIYISNLGSEAISGFYRASIPFFVA